MSIVRSPRKESNFYTLDKNISEDRRLTWGARGLLIYLLGKPDHWSVSTAALINETADSRNPSGRDAVRGFLNELIEAGYIQRTAIRKQGGKIDGYDYTVSEVPEQPETAQPATANPSSAQPETDLPATAQPATANPQLVSIETTASIEKAVRTDLFPATADAEPVPAKPAKKSQPNPLNVQTWNAYAESYFCRYGVEPVRNATVNGQIANFVKRLGDNAPHVAAHYVSGSNGYYIAKGHAVGVMLQDAEKLHTEWATGRRVTQAAARQADGTATNMENAATALAMLDAEFGGAR